MFSMANKQDNLAVLHDYICKVSTDKHNLKLRKLMLKLWDCGIF